MQPLMKILLSCIRMRWDHEPAREIQSAAGAAHSKTWRKFTRLWPTRQRLGVRRPSAAFDVSARTELVRFMESPLSVFFRMHWDLEPCRTFSCRICNIKLSADIKRFMERMRARTRGLVAIGVSAIIQ